jgi:iron complex outermembrane receptor protein
VLSLAQPVAAQTADQPAASAHGAGLEEIVVTARRREEKAQVVPIALTNLTPARLEKQDIRDNLSLLKDTPGLNGSTGASLGVSYTFLRGVSGVVSYFDEIPTLVTGVNQSYYFDVQSVQVLKGPQGTLFGLSNDAGAILYEPVKPTNNYEGYVKATLGNYDRGTFEAVVNIPVDDKLSLRFGGQFNHQDGYIHVISNNIDLLDQNYWALRGQASFRPTDDIDNELLVNYFHSRYRPGTFVFGGYSNAIPQAFQNTFGPGIGTNVQGLVTLLHEVDPKDFPTASLGAILNQQRALGPYTVQALSLDPSAQVSQLNIVDKFSYDISDTLTIKNIVGYQETIDSAFIEDIDATNLALIQGNTPLGSQPSGPEVQYNEELQLLGKAFDDKLTYVVGTFNQLGGYGAADTRAPYGIGYQNSFGTIKGATQVDRARTDAAYAQGTANLGDLIEGLSFTAGIRYTWDHFYTRGDAYNAEGVHEPNTVVIVNGKPVLVPSTVAQSADYRSPSYTWSIDYQWRPQTMFYFTNSRGYKTGGFNNTPTQIFESFALFAPEHLNNFELGTKSDFDLEALGAPSWKMRVNLSGYYGVYQNIQAQTTGAYIVQGSATPQLGTPIINVGNGDIYGYEGEITLVPDPAFEFNANFAYTRGRYDHFNGPNPNPAPGAPALVSIPGVNFEITPLWKFNLNGTYHLPIDEAYGDVSVSLAYSWQDRMILTDAPHLVSEDYLPSFDNVDMTLEWKGIMGNDQLDGRLWVTNLLNNTIAPGVLATWEVLGLVGYQPAQPQMYGATLKYSFGGENAPPAEAAPYTPPAPQAVAPVPKSYLVFFDFNKSDLTPQATQIVDQAAANAGPAHVTRLTVTGHTDTVGSDAYNMRLSRRRAESVAAQLEKDGIAASEIEIVAKGKRDLLVPTADGVREPQNRRVQIVYDGGPTS